MKTLLTILSFYGGLNMCIMMISAPIGIWFACNGILWLFFTGAFFLYPFWWIVELIKFGDLSIFGLLNLCCFIQGFFIVLVVKIISSKIAKKAYLEGGL